MPCQRLIPTLAVALFASTLFAAQADRGSYAVSGRVNGMAVVAEGGGAGWMDTAEYDLDVFVWDAANAEYLVYDGQSGQKVAEFILTVPEGPPPPDYFCQYYDASGNPDGTGTWTKT